MMRQNQCKVYKRKQNYENIPVENPVGLWQAVKSMLKNVTNAWM